MLATARTGIVLAVIENDVLADGVGMRIDGACRLGGPRVGVHTHPAEVTAKARLHIGARGSLERTTRRIQHLVDHRRRGPGSARTRSRLLQSLFLRLLLFLGLLLLAGFASGSTTAAGALPLQQHRTAGREAGNRRRRS